MREVDFISPVKVGDTVSFYTEVEKIGNTSMTIRVLVTAERGLKNRSAIKVTEAEVVMVAVDENGKSIPVK
jgi:acyl-CoA thioesterase YciA